MGRPPRLVAAGRRRLTASPAGQQLAAGPDGGGLNWTDCTARVWEVGSGRLVARLVGHAEFVFDAAFSPDGRRVATGGCDRTARVWDVEAAAEVACFRGHADAVTGVRFAADGRSLFSAGRDGVVRKWAVPG